MQEYKLLVRGLTSVTVLNPDGSIQVQNYGEFLDYLQENYLNQGWSILNAESLRVIPEDVGVGTPRIYEFAYHLVREVSPKEKLNKSADK